MLLDIKQDLYEQIKILIKEQMKYNKCTSNKLIDERYIWKNNI